MHFFLPRVISLVPKVQLTSSFPKLGYGNHQFNHWFRQRPSVDVKTPRKDCWRMGYSGLKIPPKSYLITGRRMCFHREKSGGYYCDHMIKTNATTKKTDWLSVLPEARPLGRQPSHGGVLESYKRKQLSRYRLWDSPQELAWTFQTYQCHDRLWKNWWTYLKVTKEMWQLSTICNPWLDPGFKKKK